MGEAKMIIGTRGRTTISLRIKGVSETEKSGKLATNWLQILFVGQGSWGGNLTLQGLSPSHLVCHFDDNMLMRQSKNPRIELSSPFEVLSLYVLKISRV